MGGTQLPEQELTRAEDLTGKTLIVYRFMLQLDKPIGARALSRALEIDLSTLHHHLTKLERKDLIRRESGNYVVNKILLKNCVKLNRFLIPRYFFFLQFSIGALLVELFLYPAILFLAYPVALVAQSATIAFFAYETIRIHRDGSL
jgi:DNA-binding transcriptional ArsR family regulator